MMKRMTLLAACLTFYFSSGIAQTGDIFKSDAIMYEGQGRFEEAVVNYEKAVEAYTNEGKTDTLSVYKAGQLNNRVKQYKKAEPFLLQCLAMPYHSPELFYDLSKCFEGQKNFGLAEKYLIEGKALFPDEVDRFNEKMIYLYFNSGQYEKAKLKLEPSLESAPDNLTLNYLYGSTLEKLNQYGEASKAFEKVLELDYAHKNAIRKLGYIYFKMTDSRFQEETKRYESLSNPTRVDYSNSIKKLHEISLEYNKALPLLEKAHLLFPKDEAIANCLSIARKRLDLQDKEE